MEKSDCTCSSIPIDIALKFASSLEVSDIFSLSCCSRVWREIWGSDCLWEQLFKERWPLLYEDVLKDPNFKGWRGFYLKQHKEMKGQAESVMKTVEECWTSEFCKTKDIVKAIDCLERMRFGFKDVQMFLFKPKLNGLLRSHILQVGLYYCLWIIKIPASDILEALKSSKTCFRCLFLGGRHEDNCKIFYKMFSALHRGRV